MRSRTDPLLLKASCCSLETVARLFQEPLHHASDIVTIGHVVAERGEALRFAALLHLVELLNIELLVLDGAPIVGCVVHREARRECSVGSDDDPVLPGAAAPVFTDAA